MKGTLELAIQDFDAHWENHEFVELLMALKILPNKKTSLAMAYIWAVLHSIDNIKMTPEFVLKEKEPKAIISVYCGDKIIYYKTY